MTINMRTNVDLGRDNIHRMIRDEKIAASSCSLGFTKEAIHIK